MRVLGVFNSILTRTITTGCLIVEWSSPHIRFNTCLNICKTPTRTSNICPNYLLMLKNFGMCIKHVQSVQVMISYVTILELHNFFLATLSGPHRPINNCIRLLYYLVETNLRRCLRLHADGKYTYCVERTR
jgi:hypothetical protein